MAGFCDREKWHLLLVSLEGASEMLRSLVQILPGFMREELRKIRYAWQIRNGSFVSPEPEFTLLHEWIQDGDWAIDVGANVGHYACQLSRLVGPSGRVFAFEPVAISFRLLVSNARAFPNSNVTFVNAGASSAERVVGMSIPNGNYYEAAIVEQSAESQAFVLRIDSMHIPHVVKFVKIDAEGHDRYVLEGMRELLVRDRPVVLIESKDREIPRFFEQLSYHSKKYKSSPNTVWLPSAV